MKKWEPGEHRPRGSIIQVVYPGECEIGSNQNALTTFPTHLTRGGWPQTCRMDKASKVRSHTCSNCKIWDGGTKGSWTELLFRCLEDSLNNGKRKDPPWRAIGGEEWDTSSKTRPGLPFHATLPCHPSMPPFHATPGTAPLHHRSYCLSPHTSKTRAVSLSLLRLLPPSQFCSLPPRDFFPVHPIPWKIPASHSCLWPMDSPRPGASASET